ncbi:hypothetical protein DFQ27_008053 [Actinomortierella ambigua]|uniref:F-box domain-containing protein n=1 Tax=Actinomortierella ambigua TaxID=1343610 RepID=A0A9P6QIG3_9FUNG|nr:hypothetical protein DFQ27_008053 [Actinomortierella ambigua]
MPSIHDLFAIPEFACWTGRALGPQDLYQCVLVSKTWAYAFTPFLWSSFGSEEIDDPYSSSVEDEDEDDEDDDDGEAAPNLPFSPRLSRLKLEISLWERFIVGLHITPDESDFVNQTLAKRGKHIRHLAIESTQGLEHYDALGCWNRLETLSCVLVPWGMPSPPSSPRPMSPLSPLPSSRLSSHTCHRPNNANDHRAMIWRIIRTSPRLSSLIVRGVAVLPPPPGELEAFLEKQGKWLQRLEVKKAVGDKLLMDLANVLPRLLYARVDLDLPETVSLFQAAAINNTIRPHPSLTVLVLYTPRTQGRVEVAFVAQLLKVFPQLQELALHLPHGFGMYMATRTGKTTTGGDGHLKSKGKGKGKGKGNNNNQLKVVNPDWGDADLAQLVQMVPCLRSLHGVEMGPLTVKALVDHSRTHLESCEMEVMGDEILTDDLLESADPPRLQPLLQSCRKLKRLRCPEGVLEVHDVLHCKRWPCLWGPLEYLECQVIGIPMLTPEEVIQCELLESEPVVDHDLLRDDQKAALAKQRRRDECLQAMFRAMTDIPFECTVKIGRLVQFSTILIELHRQPSKQQQQQQQQ